MTGVEDNATFSGPLSTMRGIVPTNYVLVVKLNSVVSMTESCSQGGKRHETDAGKHSRYYQRGL